jgi:predicted N-acyltransferase
VQQAGGSVLSSHAFLSAFEESESVSIETGWQAKHLILRNETGELIAEFLGPRNPIDRSFQPPTASD